MYTDRQVILYANVTYWCKKALVEQVRREIYRKVTKTHKAQIYIPYSSQKYLLQDRISW